MALSKAFKDLSKIGKLKAEAGLFAQCSGDAVYRLRYDTMQYDYISPSVLNLLGYTASELMKINMRSLIVETRIIGNASYRVDSYQSLEENRKKREVGKWQADYLMKTRDGRKIWVCDISYPWFDKKGAIIGSNGSLRDIHERVLFEEKLRNQHGTNGFMDQLTRLPNVQHFWSKLEEEVKRTKRTRDNMSLMLIAVTDFRDIKDLYSSEISDDIIVRTSILIRNALREIDLLARIGEDLFAVLMVDTASDGALFAAKRLVKKLAGQEILVSSETASLSQSYNLAIGIADNVKNPEYTDSNAIYNKAVAELTRARKKGDNQISCSEI